MPHAFRCADLRDAGAGPQPRRHQGRQQGLRSRRRRHRDGRPASQDRQQGGTRPDEPPQASAASRANSPCRCSFRGTLASRRRTRCARPSGRRARRRSTPTPAALPKTSFASPSRAKRRSTQLIEQHSAHWRIAAHARGRSQPAASRGRGAARLSRNARAHRHQRIAGDCEALRRAGVPQLPERHTRCDCKDSEVRERTATGDRGRPLCCLSRLCFYGMALGFTARNCAGVTPPLPSGRFALNCSVSVSVLVDTRCMLPSPAVETNISDMVRAEDRRHRCRGLRAGQRSRCSTSRPNPGRWDRVHRQPRIARSGARRVIGHHCK